MSYGLTVMPDILVLDAKEMRARATRRKASEIPTSDNKQSLGVKSNEIVIVVENVYKREVLRFFLNVCLFVVVFFNMCSQSIMLVR